MPPASTMSLMNELNLLVAGFFLLCSFGLIAATQALSCARVYYLQSFLLMVDALLLARLEQSPELLAVAGIVTVTKLILIPLVLRRTARQEMIARREIEQVISVPMSLLIALLLAPFGFFVALPLYPGAAPAAQVDLPIGLTAVLIAIYTITVRREALPQMFSLLAIENAAFFAGDAIAPHFPLIGEVAAAFDVLMIVLVLGVLSARIHRFSGTTQVGALAELREVGWDR